MKTGARQGLENDIREIITGLAEREATNLEEFGASMSAEATRAFRDVILNEAVEEIAEKAYRRIGVALNCRRVKGRISPKFVVNGGSIDTAIAIDCSDENLVDMHALAGQPVEIIGLQTEMLGGEFDAPTQQELDLARGANRAPAAPAPSAAEPPTDDMPEPTPPEEDYDPSTEVPDNVLPFDGAPEATAPSPEDSVWVVVDPDNNVRSDPPGTLEQARAILTELAGPEPEDGWTVKPYTETEAAEEGAEGVTGSIEPPADVVLYHVVKPDKTVMTGALLEQDAWDEMDRLAAAQNESTEGWLLMTPAEVEQMIADKAEEQQGKEEAESGPVLDTGASEENAPATESKALNDKQAKAAVELRSGGTVEEAASVAGVTVRTVNRWMETNEAFKAAATPDK